MFVRSAKEEDLDGLYDLCCEQAARVLPRDVFTAVFRAAAKDAHRRLVVAIEDEQIVGYADMQLSLLLSHCALAAVFNEFYVREALRGAPTETQRLILDAEGVSHVDSAGLDALRDLADLGPELHIARAKSALEAHLEGIVPPECFHPTVRDAVALTRTG